MSPVFVKTYDSPPYNQREILRYAGVKGEVDEINRLLEECLQEVDGKLHFKACFAQFDLKRLGDTLDLGFTRTSSKALSKNLENCDMVVAFAATVGIEADRLIAKYNVLSPAKALAFQAIGAERIESLCDLIYREISEKYKCVKPRFSPGYGDFPLEVQREIFAALDCPKKIGVTLNESLLMSPSKSVTAIIGVINDGCGKTDAEKSGCTGCGKIDCAFRREVCL